MVALDRDGIEEMAAELRDRGEPGDPETLRRLLVSVDLARDTAPLATEWHDGGPLEDWTVETEDEIEVTPWLVRFDSPLDRLDQTDRGVLYFY